MSGYVITVTFQVKPGAMAAFRKLMDENARASCRDEQGCHRFDVLVPPGRDDTVFLYEIYQDRAAFEAHLKTPHFAVFDRDSAPLVEGKTVKDFKLVCEGSRA
ncbi:putative quinol monooxygenase [Aestuariivirga sp.]|uniref:putative quinol monooxygenase n=1 Tax=Aestuariivirga sp. TaxID=2650926 RepID=UPI0039E30E47